jgi:hypothetical protein
MANIWRALVRFFADVPPFATIAPAGFSLEKLAFFLLEPHPNMPNMALTRCNRHRRVHCQARTSAAN